MSASDAEFGRAPSYSTATTLWLALVSLAASLLHGGLGATDYPLSRPWGLTYILLSGFALVYGILLLIRYAEARDAMSDPLPRTPMYDTAHERGNHVIGLGLHGLLGACALGWAVQRQVPVMHGLALLLSGLAWMLLARSRPGRAGVKAPGPGSESR
ncbi:hypothetical protein [Deinococcus sp.]|uniref:hypothetical protein n=1 Tax=Deinococcus sp. TaxID=47478 RepID=UPI003CC50910